MIEWINQNKEWFLSGAGLLLLNGIVGFASVLLTLLWGAGEDRKRRKSIQLNITRHLISTVKPDSFGPIETPRFTVSYKNGVYDRLFLFSVVIRNAGKTAITGQRLHFLIPKEANVVEIIDNRSLNSISMLRSEQTHEKAHEHIFTIDRLEPNDNCAVAYLIDFANPDSIECLPRGVDEVEYSYSRDFQRSEIEKIILLAAFFVFAGAIPVVGDVAQALVILASMPTILEFYRRRSVNHPLKHNQTIIVDGSNNRIDVAGRDILSEISNSEIHDAGKKE